jgi:hypothetical protein
VFLAYLMRPTVKRTVPARPTHSLIEPVCAGHLATISAREFKAQCVTHVARTGAPSPKAGQAEGNRAALLLALIDDQLPEVEAERVLLELPSDAGLARRFAEMSQATAVMRASYQDALDVFGRTVAVYALAVDEARRLVELR